MILECFLTVACADSLASSGVILRSLSSVPLALKLFGRISMNSPLLLSLLIKRLPLLLFDLKSVASLLLRFVDLEVISTSTHTMLADLSASKVFQGTQEGNRVSMPEL